MLNCARIALHLASLSFLAAFLPENRSGSLPASRGLPACSRFECTAAFVYLWERFGSAQGNHDRSKSQGCRNHLGPVGLYAQLARQSRFRRAFQLISGLLLAAIMPAVASAAVSINLSQCGNLASGAPTDCSWQNGNLNSNQAHWQEGDSVPYQLVMSGLTPNTSYTITFGYGTTKGGKHAIDYLTRGYRHIVFAALV